jgi:hypothetical protein
MRYGTVFSALTRPSNVQIYLSKTIFGLQSWQLRGRRLKERKDVILETEQTSENARLQCIIF